MTLKTAEVTIIHRCVCVCVNVKCFWTCPSISTNRRLFSLEGRGHRGQVVPGGHKKVRPVGLKNASVDHLTLTAHVTAHTQNAVK